MKKTVTKTVLATVYTVVIDTLSICSMVASVVSIGNVILVILQEWTVIKMTEYICREAIIDDLEKEIEAGNEALDEDVWINKGLRIAIRDIKDIKTADVQPVNQWISVKDRLPKSGQSVLIYYPKWDGDEIQVARLDNDGMTFDICGEFNVGTGVVTHWMPLPESPKDGDKSVRT